MDADDFAPSGSFSVNSSTRFRSSLMGRSRSLSSVFKTVQPGLFNTNTLQRGPLKAFQTFENLDANIFRGRNILAKLRDFFVQVLVVEGFNDFAFNKGVEIGEVRDHSRGPIHRAGDGDI